MVVFDPTLFVPQAASGGLGRGAFLITIILFEYACALFHFIVCVACVVPCRVVSCRVHCFFFFFFVVFKIALVNSSTRVPVHWASVCFSFRFVSFRFFSFVFFSLSFTCAR